MQSPSCSLLFLLALVATTPAADNRVSVTVRAGDFERQQTVVSFALPENAREFNQVRDPQGKSYALQVDKNGRAAFVVPRLNKGAQTIYELVLSRAAPASAAAARREHTKVNVSVSGHRLLEYQAEPGELPRDNIKPLFRRGGYIHPLQTWSGKPVTDDFPINHVHHHGVWWAWTKTAFDGRQPDFWNMGQGKGRVDFVAVDQNWSGSVHGGFTARHQFVDLSGPKPAVALNEGWDVRVYNTGESEPFWIFDLTSTQICATTNALKLPEYHYGGIGLRGNWAWNGKDKCSFLTSEGETDREKAHGTRGRWCDMWGQVSGADAGLAILCHPENFRAPQPMRIHPSEPFFCYAPQQAGDMEIAPAKPYGSRYRFVVHDGRPHKEVLERLWNDYAHPPKVEIAFK
jgi:hypothetical protein